MMNDFACLAAVLAAFAAALPAVAAVETPRDGLALSGVGSGGRNVISPDPVQARIVAGTWTPPVAGEEVAGRNGRTARWRVVHANEKGEFDLGEGPTSYVYVPFRSSEARTVLLEASGHGMVYVNGEPRTGDIYGYGYVSLPVRLEKGENSFLFSGTRGQLSVRFAEPRAPVSLNVADPTLPDFRDGEKGPRSGAVLIVNATDKTARGYVMEAAVEGGRAEKSKLPDVPPMTVRKAPFNIPEPPPGVKAAVVRLTLRDGSRVADTAQVEVRRRSRGETYKRTFVSAIDGSLQYYAVNPVQREGKAPAALVLSLHGASVEAIGQADAYAGKLWANIVCPTNRRPYGFDWEDWGRLDALEVLDLASRELPTDPARVYLTGHSMGGHGTWQVGANSPDRFAAIAPSAGWISVKSYAQGQRFESPTPVESMLDRAASAADTLALSPNYADRGVYILHGDADDNVPVTEAREMVEALKGFHKDWVVHEQPGAGHWWDVSDEPGADCVDWPPLFDFLARHALPSADQVRQVRFVTANPGVLASLHWVTVVQQQRSLALSRVDIRRDPWKRRFAGTTDNVARLTLSVKDLPRSQTVRVELDGGALDVPWPGDGLIHLKRDGDAWSATTAVPAGEKNPRRAGPLRLGFQNRMVFVYGTSGTPEENAWSYAKARFDAENWWYRGNGAVDVVADTAFDAERQRDRSVVLYGNADTNRQFARLLGDSPVRVRRGGVTVGERALPEDLACLFVRPRPGSDTASVVVVGATGPKGARLLDRLPYLQPMIGFPDLLLVSPDALTTGTAGIRAAGFFGPGWGMEDGEFAWQ
jgi:poly(3-hydroxybutyrate) depolymerase